MYLHTEMLCLCRLTWLKVSIENLSLSTSCNNTKTPGPKLTIITKTRSLVAAGAHKTVPQTHCVPASTPYFRFRGGATEDIISCFRIWGRRSSVKCSLGVVVLSERRVCERGGGSWLGEMQEGEVAAVPARLPSFSSLSPHESGRV